MTGFHSLVLKKPVCVMKEVIPQETVGSVCIKGDVTLDEIRIGPTLHSVMLGTRLRAGESEKQKEQKQ